MYKIQTLNKIAACGLDRLPRDNYESATEIVNPDGILLRSADMHSMEIPASVKAIARAGAGVNNIPLDKCTERGIVVFNTPGANANAVKELVIAGMLMGTRNIAPALTFVNGLFGDDESLHKQVEAGKLKLLAIGSPQRSPLYPNVPTLAESGLNGFDADTLFGIYAPAGTPPAVVDAVRASVLKALEQKNVVDVIQGLGATPEPTMSRQDFVGHHAKERARFAPLIKEIGLKVD